MGFELTNGTLMFFGGIAAAVAALIFILIYLPATSAKAKKLLEKINKEEL